MRRHGNKARGRRAFTLTELLVVVGIIAMMAALTTAAVLPMLEGRSLRNGARAVQALLYQARTYAAVNRAKANLVFYTADQSMLLSNDADGLAIDKRAFLPRGVKFADDPPVTAVSGGTIEVSFGSTGSLDTTAMGLGNCRIRLSDMAGDKIKVVEVAFTSGLTRTYDE